MPLDTRVAEIPECNPQNDTFYELTYRLSAAAARLVAGHLMMPANPRSQRTVAELSCHDVDWTALVPLLPQGAWRRTTGAPTIESVLSVQTIGTRNKVRVVPVVEFDVLTGQVQAEIVAVRALDVMSTTVWKAISEVLTTCTAGLRLDPAYLQTLTVEPAAFSTENSTGIVEWIYLGGARSPLDCRCPAHELPTPERLGRSGLCRKDAGRSQGIRRRPAS